jgi:hypothetical protein
MNHSLTLNFFAVANKAKQQRGIRALSSFAFMLRSVPASVAFEPRSKNKKKGDKRGVLGGIEGGRKITRPVGVIIKLRIAGAD